jgi:transcriptional regulator with XRE-family HTH domain
MGDNMSKEKLAELVRERRKALGMTQPQVAERGDVSAELVRRVENNRSGRLRASKIEGLERALEWEPGSIRVVLGGGVPTVVHRAPDEPASTRRTRDHAPMTAGSSEAGIDRFALAHHVLALRDTFTAHQGTIGQEAREALSAEMARSAREAEDSIILMMPWLDDTERGDAIDLLVELRKALQINATQ